MAAAIASVTTFGLSGFASAGEEFVAGCIENSQAAKEQQGATDEMISAFCSCLDGQIGDNEAAIQNLTEAAGDPSKLSEEVMGAIQACSGQ